MSDFLPKNYEAPKSNSYYTKFEKGATKIRILSSAITGMEVWRDNKPHRFRDGEKITIESDQGKMPKHFWAMVVWNYRTEQVEICEITQASIQNMISACNMNDDYGNPKGYDITITREGEGMETKYTVMPSPPKSVSEEILQAYKDRPIRLDALYDGEDPFKPQEDNNIKQAKEIFDNNLPQ